MCTSFSGLSREETYLMSRRAVVTIVLLLSSYSLFAAPVQGGAPAVRPNSDPFYLQLRNIKVGTESVHVKDFTLKKDAGVFVFHSGVFSLLEPVNGKITGAVFNGDATFSMTPPTNVEKRDLAILTRGEPFEERFSSAVFRFTDGTEQDLRKGAVTDPPRYPTTPAVCFLIFNSSSGKS